MVFPISRNDFKLMNKEHNDKLNRKLPQSTITAVDELGKVLRSIHTRLISEGYTISNGIISK